jgi:hypothetical protein
MIVKMKFTPESYVYPLSCLAECETPNVQRRTLNPELGSRLLHSKLGVER